MLLDQERTGRFMAELRKAKKHDTGTAGRKVRGEQSQYFTMGKWKDYAGSLTASGSQ